MELGINYVWPYNMTLLLSSCGSNLSYSVFHCLIFFSCTEGIKIPIAAGYCDVWLGHVCTGMKFFQSASYSFTLPLSFHAWEAVPSPLSHIRLAGSILVQIDGEAELRRLPGKCVLASLASQRTKLVLSASVEVQCCSWNASASLICNSRATYRRLFHTGEINDAFFCVTCNIVFELPSFHVFHFSNEVFILEQF